MQALEKALVTVTTLSKTPIEAVKVDTSTRAEVLPVTDAKVVTEVPTLWARALWHFMLSAKLNVLTAPLDVQVRLVVMVIPPPPPPPPAYGTTLPTPGRPPAPSGICWPGHCTSTEGSTWRVAVASPVATWKAESGITTQPLMNVPSGLNPEKLSTVSGPTMTGGPATPR